MINKKLQIRTYLILGILISNFYCKTKSPSQDSSDINLNSHSNSVDLVAGDSLFKKGTNIIFILGDDVGYEIPGYTGGESYLTPNLDFMAKNGVQFSKCYSAPLCSPSRFMLLTGKYNFRNYTGWGEFPVGEKSIATLLQSAGYKTCLSGKWQMAGGNEILKAAGFDNYLRANEMSEEWATRGKPGYYKYPAVFENGAYWPNSKVQGKYGQDLFRDYVFSFIDANKNKNPFFIYWSMNLPHKPFSPTPDDPAYSTWPQAHGYLPQDTIYFPGMIKYMDKQIGQLIDKLKKENLLNNTIIIFAGDNGTDHISSRWNGQIVTGQKNSTNEYGTHVPLIVYGPEQIRAGYKDESLIDFTDFMPTLASLADASLPSSYFSDGVNFAPRLKGYQGTPREWIFCSFQPHPEKTTMKAKRWIQDSIYKKYDSDMAGGGNFYNIKNDPFEQHPINRINMTLEEKKINDKFLAQMKLLH